MGRSPKEWRELLSLAGNQFNQIAEILDDWESQEKLERHDLLEDIMEPLPNDLLKDPNFKLMLHTFIQYAILQDKIGIVESAKIISKMIAEKAK